MKDINKNTNKFWIIIFYIATLDSGELKIIEKGKNWGYENYTLDNVNLNELSDCALSSYYKIKENWYYIE